MISECEIHFLDKRIAKCAHGAICRRAIMKKYAYEWNKNNTGGRIEDGGSSETFFTLSASQIRGCVCKNGFYPARECMDSTLDDLRFARPELRTNISHLFSNSTTDLVPRCTNASLL